MNDKPIRVRRSALYMPCSNQRALQKAMSLDADVLLFDLEDAVAPDSKDQARANIIQALADNDYGYREKIVRVNPVDGPWGYDDLKALAQSPLDGILLPKVETAEQVNQALAVLGRDLPVWAMVETPAGVLQVETIAGHTRVAALVMGTNDLAKELRVEQSAGREEFSYAFGRCVMAARAFGCDILDGVYNQLDDESGLEAVCRQGRSLGFDGKTLIHPKQLAAANASFMPDQQQVEQARQIIDAWQQSQDKGVIVVNGKLVESLHVDEARRCLETVQIIKKR